MMLWLNLFVLLSINVFAQTKLKTLKFDNDFVTSVHYLPDGKYIISSSFNRNLILWDVQTGKIIWNHDFDDRRDKNNLIVSEISSTAVTEDGKLIAAAVKQSHIVKGRLTGDSINTIFLLDSTSGKILNTIKDGIAPLVFSSDGTLASKITNPRNNQILRNIGGGTVIWDVKTSTPLQKINYERDTFPTSFSPDGRYLAVGLKEPQGGSATDFSDLIVWDVREEKEIKGISLKSRFVDSAAFSPDGKMLVMGGEAPNEMLFINTQNWESIISIENEVGRDKITFAPNGKQLVSIESNSESGYIYLLNALT